MSTKNKIANTSDREHRGLINAAQVADFLAVNRTTVWRLTQQVNDPLPCLRFGIRNTRFRLADIDAWLNRQGGRK